MCHLQNQTCFHSAQEWILPHLRHLTFHQKKLDPNDQRKTTMSNKSLEKQRLNPNACRTLNPNFIQQIKP